MTARWRQVYPSESSASRRLGWRFSYHYTIHRSGGKRLIFFHTNGIFCVYVSLSLYLTTPGRPREDLDRWEPGCRHNSGERSCLTIVTIVKLYEKIKRTCTHTQGSTLSVTCPISERKKLRPLTNDFLHSVFETLVSYKHWISWGLVGKKKHEIDEENLFFVLFLFDDLRTWWQAAIKTVMPSSSLLTSPTSRIM